MARDAHERAREFRSGDRLRTDLHDVRRVRATSRGRRACAEAIERVREVRVMSFASLRTRARRLGWRLRRLNARGPLAARYAMKLGRADEFRASDLSFVRSLIVEAERRAS